MGEKLLLIIIILVFFFTGIRFLQFNQCVLQNDSPYRSVFCFLPSYLDTHRFQTLSVQSSHLNFDLPDFISTYCFHRNAFFTAVPSDVFTRSPANSSILISLLLRYLVYSSLPAIHYQLGFSSRIDLLLDHISFLVFSVPLFQGMISLLCHWRENCHLYIQSPEFISGKKLSHTA